MNSTINALIAAKNLKFVHTIDSVGHGILLTIKRAFVSNGQVFIDTDKGTITFGEAEVIRIENCVNNSVNLYVKDHKEVYNLIW